MTLPAFAAERRAAAPCCCAPAGARRWQWLYPDAGLLAENLPATATAVERWDRQTDGWTSDRYIDPAPHTMQHWCQQYRQMLKNASAAKLYETVGH